MSNGRTKQWRKVLYETNGFPDNYTPEQSFLAAIQRNKNIRLYTKNECFKGASMVGRQMSLVITFWSLYVYLSEGVIDSEQLILALTLVISAGYLSYLRKFCLPVILSGIKTTFVFFTIGFALSPVLYKLTDTISTDTIHTMALFGFLVHLVTQFYGIHGPIVSKSISLNSAIFSAVCLASRFQTHMQAFSLLCLAVFCFLLVPMWSSAYVPNTLKSLLSAMVSVCMLARVLQSYAVLTALLLFIVQLCCPLLFYHLQSYKQTIHGPWDEASLD